MKIAVGTTSGLKVRALKNALDNIQIEANVLPVKADSGISKQPFGYGEMIIGAKNRAQQALDETSSDFTVGIENGLVEIEGNYFDIACIYIKTKANDESITFSSGISIPDWVIEEIKERDTEGGEITKRLSGDSEKDTGKYFSGGMIKREDILSQAIQIAFAKILNKEKYIK
ncbi:MAG: inosine/xanthosine triphosphatase [Candidatus Paceibacterota bacterium]|jgi:inosine/xanthosine triphosphatase